MLARVAHEPLRALATEPVCAALREAVGLGAESRVVLIATEGPTDPDGYRGVVGRGEGGRPDRA